MTSIKTSSTTPGQRSPDMGGFFQLLYHGSFGAGYRSVSGTKTGNWTLEEIGSYSNKKRAAESISNRIIWKKRVLQWRKSKASLHKCSCTTTTTTDGKLGFFSMYQTVLLQLFIAVWVSGQALTSDFGCPKNQVSHGIPKGIPAFTKVWPNKPAAHGVKLWPLGCLCFFWHIFFFYSRFPTDFGNKLYTEICWYFHPPPVLEIDAFFNPAWVLRVVGHPPISKVVEAAILAMVPLAQDVHH